MRLWYSSLHVKKTQVERFRISNEKFSRIPRTSCVAAASQKHHIAGGLEAKEIRIGIRYIAVDNKLDCEMPYRVSD